MTLIKQWSDLSDEEKDRLRKKMLRIDPSLAPKPDIKLVQTFDKKDPLGIQDGVREFMEDSRTYSLPPDLPPLDIRTTTTVKQSSWMTSVIDKEKNIKMQKIFSDMVDLLFNQTPSPLFKMMKDLQNVQTKPPTFHWWGQRQRTQPMTRYEAFQKLSGRQRNYLRSGYAVQAFGHRFTNADLQNPPKPQQPPPATGHQNLGQQFNTKGVKICNICLNKITSDLVLSAGVAYHGDCLKRAKKSAQKWGYQNWYEDFEEEPDIDPKEEMAKVTPHLILDKETFDLVTPYNKPFINALKKSFLSGERGYDFKRKVWTINRSENNVEIAKRLIREHFSVKPQMFSKEGDIQATYDTAVDVTSKYGILGVEPDASQDEIKRAFRRIAKKLHGDVSEADQEFFILAKKAYDTLKDPNKRARYDLARKIMTSKLERDTGLKLTSRDLHT